jgi:hypothetical protein
MYPSLFNAESSGKLVVLFTVRTVKPPSVSVPDPAQ